MLTTGSLYFARSDLLGDKFEGAQGVLRRGSEQNVSERFSFLNEVPIRKSVFINCWHSQAIEVAAMWRLYGTLGESIAIRTTFEKLRAALPHDVLIGKVHYVNYLNLPPEAKDPVGRFFYKRRSFEMEHEIRAVQFVPNKLGGLGKSHAVDLESLIERIYVDPTSQGWFKKCVKGLLEKFEIEIEVRRSNLAKDPIF